MEGIIMKAFVSMEANNIIDIIGFLQGLDPAIFTQWIGVIIAGLGIGWGFREKSRGNRIGHQEIAKNALEQIIEENKILISKINKMRKDSDKWILLRKIVLGLPDGSEIIKKVEAAADDISSNED